MRVAILADIHGNLPAVEAVLEDIARTSPDYIVAAGDLALRGAHPREVVELLDDRCDALLMGNTDCYIAGNYLGGAYREKDHWKAELLNWTRDQLGSAWVKRLGELPFSMRYSPRRGQDLFVCHANPRNLEESVDPTLDERQLHRFFHHLDAAAVAFGHLHFPYRRRVGRMVIADVASAGIPRDGDLRPAWGLFTYTPKGWRVQIRRVRYHVKKATQAIQARKVPGAPLLIHKMIEARYRHHAALQEAARRHSGLPPLHAHHAVAHGLRSGVLPPPPGARPVTATHGELGVRPPTPVELANDREDSLSDGRIPHMPDIMADSGEHPPIRVDDSFSADSGEHPAISPEERASFAADHLPLGPEDSGAHSAFEADAGDDAEPSDPGLGPVRASGDE